MSFTTTLLEKKFSELTSSQQSVQTLSLWLIHHRKHAAKVVEVWRNNILKDHRDGMLRFVYLANDILQNSKKKGPEYMNEFSLVLEEVFEELYRVSDGPMHQSLDRILKIWVDRAVLNQGLLSRLQSLSGVESVVEPKPKKRRSSSTNVERTGLFQPPIKIKVPEPEVLLHKLSELETATSADDQIRLQIATLPDEVQIASFVDGLETREEADGLQQRVDDTGKLLSSYNSRLDQEREQRQHVIALLQAFIKDQASQQEKVQSLHDEHRKRLDHVIQIQAHLRNHLANLPDLTELPSITGGLDPLPSAHDLFS